MDNMVLSTLNLNDLTNHLVGEMKKEFNNSLQSYFSNQEKTDKQELITRKQAADLLHISEVTLWSYQKTGKIRMTKFGRRVLFNKTELLEDIRNFN